METIVKEYVISKENSWMEYRDNKTRYYSISDSEYFDGIQPLKEAKEHAKNKGYESLRIIYSSIGKKDKLINLK